MAKHTLKDCVVVVNDVDLSDHVRSATIETTRPEVDVTGMGATNTEIVPGIGDATITIEFLQDYAVGEVDATLWPLSQTDTPFNVDVKASSAATAATNPLYRMSALMYSYSPIAGGVGDANTTEVTFRNASQAGVTQHTTDPT